jgi:asparagine synthase (glutamine-hydrolysing)
VSGICGLVIREGGIDRMTGTLQAMLEALASPAPGEEFLLNQGKAGLAARGFPGRRAGVAGIRAGNGSVGLAFHGSLYNLRDLVAAESRAPDASGALLRLYLAEGIGFLTRFRGEFVLAVWDQREDSLYLATDRFRVHPLFYHASRDRLLFSSRLAGLYQTPSSPGRTVDPEAVVDLLAFSAIPTPKTIFREARKLPPGHLLTYRAGEARLERYWDLDFREPSVAGRKALGARLKSIFAEAVFIRLASEEDSNRVGCFLSGGVDSSTVAGVLTELRQGPVKSFSIGFDEPRFNEMAYARIAARAFGAQHHEYVVTARDTCEAIPILLDAFDEPYANASAVPTYFCARLMRESGVDAAYAGDGGDELFAGNERYAAHRIFDYYGRIPPWMRRALIEPVVFSLHRYLGWTLLDKGRKYIQRANIPRARRITSYGFFNVVAARDLLNGDLLESLGGDYDPYGAVASFYDGAPAATELDRELYLDLHLAISDNDLFKVTRMTEAAGLPHGSRCAAASCAPSSRKPMPTCFRGQPVPRPSTGSGFPSPSGSRPTRRSGT